MGEIIMGITIRKSYIILLTTATLSTAALAVGAYSYRAPDWRNSAIKDLATSWGISNRSGLASGTGRGGMTAGFSRVAAVDVDFAFLWSSVAMKNLGTLPTVTFNWAKGIKDADRAVGQAVAMPVSPLVNGTARYFAEAAGPAYGNSPPPLLSKGTIDDPYRQLTGKTTQEGTNPTPVPTPVPAALSLFGSGLAFLELMRRKMFSNHPVD
jgi:hypothetical protein